MANLDHQQESTNEGAERDLRLELTVKNNVLWHAIYDKYGSVSALCRAHSELQVKEGTVGKLLQFKLSLWNKDGEYRLIVLQLSKILCIPVDHLFPEHLYASAIQSKKVIEIESFSVLPLTLQREIRALPAPVESSQVVMDQVLLRERIDEVLQTLPPKHQDILRRRFGFEPYKTPQTTDEVADAHGVSRSRISQKEEAAMRKLRHPIRARLLENFITQEK